MFFSFLSINIESHVEFLGKRSKLQTTVLCGYGSVILFSAIWLMMMMDDRMNAARGIDKRETGTPKKVVDPIIVIPAIDMDWDLNIMRKREPFKQVSIFS